MLAPTPTSTLFPYTTLFRSVLKEPCTTAAALHENFTNEGGVGGTYRFLKNVNGMWLLTFFRNRYVDRKSTRLNSSHEWISYAVFCLKKKKKQHRTLK